MIRNSCWENLYTKLRRLRLGAELTFGAFPETSFVRHWIGSCLNVQISQKISFTTTTTYSTTHILIPNTYNIISYNIRSREQCAILIGCWYIDWFDFSKPENQNTQHILFQSWKKEITYRVTSVSPLDIVSTEEEGILKRGKKVEKKTMRNKQG